MLPPFPETAVHWLLDGHATPLRTWKSTLAIVGVPGEVGLNVTSRPKSSTAVHWLADTQTKA
jgi:hypothetical protein